MRNAGGVARRSGLESRLRQPKAFLPTAAQGRIQVWHAEQDNLMTTLNPRSSLDTDVVRHTETGKAAGSSAK